MKIKILFDSKKLNRTLLAGWGVSYLIQNRILFDTGERSGCLFSNMDSMGVRIQDMPCIFESSANKDDGKIPSDKIIAYIPQDTNLTYIMCDHVDIFAFTSILPSRYIIRTVLNW